MITRMRGVPGEDTMSCLSGTDHMGRKPVQALLFGEVQTHRSRGVGIGEIQGPGKEG